MGCSNCSKDLRIVNKHFNLCLSCNNDRLASSKPRKTYNVPTKPKKATRTTNNTSSASKGVRHNYSFVKNLPSANNKKSDKIKRDELFYEKCFELSDHKCEECGCQLPTEFRDDNGKVIARFRYSHIIPKSIAPELRHKTNNINHLCLRDHMEWENGDKENMNIYAKNVKRLPNYF